MATDVMKSWDPFTPEKLGLSVTKSELCIYYWSVVFLFLLKAPKNQTSWFLNITRVSCSQSNYIRNQSSYFWVKSQWPFAFHKKKRMKLHPIKQVNFLWTFPWHYIDILDQLSCLVWFSNVTNCVQKKKRLNRLSVPQAFNTRQWLPDDCLMILHNGAYRQFK